MCPDLSAGECRGCRRGGGRRSPSARRDAATCPGRLPAAPRPRAAGAADRTIAASSGATSLASAEKGPRGGVARRVADDGGGLVLRLGSVHDPRSLRWAARAAFSSGSARRGLGVTGESEKSFSVTAGSRQPLHCWRCCLRGSGSPWGALGPRASLRPRRSHPAPRRRPYRALHAHLADALASRSAGRRFIRVRLAFTGATAEPLVHLALRVLARVVFSQPSG